MKVGDVVSFVYQRQVVHAQIVRWTGKPDDHVTLYDKNLFPPYRKYADSLVEAGCRSIFGTVFLTPDEAVGIGAEMDRLMATKRGREAMRIVTQRRAQSALMPKPGRGVPATYQEPLKLARGMSSDWSSDMQRYLVDYRIWQRQFRALKERYPKIHEAIFESEKSGKSLADVARALGITHGAARKRYSRGLHFLRQRCEADQRREQECEEQRWTEEETRRREAEAEACRQYNPYRPRKDAA